MYCLKDKCHIHNSKLSSIAKLGKGIRAFLKNFWTSDITIVIILFSSSHGFVSYYLQNKLIEKVTNIYLSLFINLPNIYGFKSLLVYQ